MKINSISELALSKIKPKMTISLGGGSTVFKLAQAIAQHNLNITLYSPSELTCFKCKELGLELLPSTAATKIDIAFDGCDSIDKNFNVLKVQVEFIFLKSKQPKLPSSLSSSCLVKEYNLF